MPDSQGRGVRYVRVVEKITTYYIPTNENLYINYILNYAQIFSTRKKTFKSSMLRPTVI